MKTTTNPFTQDIKNFVASFTSVDSFTAGNPGLFPTNTKLITTAGPEGSVIKSIMVSSSDTVARTIAFYISPNEGQNKYLICTIAIPIGAGFATAANVDIFGSLNFIGQTIDQTGRPVLPIQAGHQLYAGVVTAAVTASKNLYVTGSQEDF